MKTEAQRERKKRWLAKHPEYTLKRLEKWYSRETNSKEKKNAERLVKKYQEKVKALDKKKDLTDN